jgi:hypothetical protein
MAVLKSDPPPMPAMKSRVLMSDEEVIAQHMIRLANPEVDWSTHEDETTEKALARQRLELKALAREKAKRTRFSRAVTSAREIVTAALWVFAVSAAFGSALAIVRALWRLAGRV